MQVTPFVGREREIVELRHRLERMLAGHGQLILLAGEPGIGKTRLAEGTAAEAERRAARVLWGQCYEWEGAPAYWPWIQVIRSFLRGRDPQTIRDHLGTDAADIAQLVPEIREWLPDLSPLPRLDPEQSRFRLFSAVTRFLENSTEHQPLVMVLDDVHWADEPSLRLLHFVIQGIRDTALLIVVTYRLSDLGRRPELARILADVTRERAVQQHVLRGLPKPDVVQFIVRTIHGEPPAALVDAVYRETEGNPFFVTEVVRLLINEGALDPPVQTSAWRIRIPESVRSVVGRRLDRLSQDCRDALSVASVIGRAFSVSMLEPLADLEPVQLLDVLDEAVHAQLVQAEDTLGHYTFSHALVQDTLYQRLSTSRRARLHQTAGDIIEQFHGNDPPYYAELAHHYFQAIPTGDAARAVVYATSTSSATTSADLFSSSLRPKTCSIGGSSSKSRRRPERT